MKNLPIILAFLFPFAVTAQKKIEQKPTRSLAKVILDGKKDYTYYALSEKVRTEYVVTGPGKLYLNYRVRLENGAFRSEPMKVKCTKGSNHVEMIELPELLSSNLKFKSSKLEGSPTRLHQVVIDVPPGKHTYRFYKQPTDQKAHMRAFYTKSPKPKWVALKPSNEVVSKNVVFKKSGRIKPYRQLTKKSDFEFSILDSVYLRVVVRPEFTYSMLDETVLKLRLENLTNGISNTYKVNSKRSGIVEFETDKKNTPGRSRIFYIKLDKPLSGTDKYAFKLISGAKAAVIRVSKDLNNTK